MATTIFEPFSLKQLNVKNRVVMAPMTRCRASSDHIPTDIMIKYYAQRANAGLIISEGVAPSPNGLGYARIPGLYNENHVAAWRKITTAVHENKGLIFAQLMHTGRVSHPLNMPENTQVLAPSPIPPSETMWTDQEGMQNFPVPKQMTEEDIRQTIDEYTKSAELAIEAGFDGVELHGANGYLIDQFLNVASNQRTDRWGADTIENRARFATEIATAVCNQIGAERTGIRLSPYGVFNNMTADDNMDALFTHLAKTFSQLNMAYIHLVDHSAMGAPEVSQTIKDMFRETFKGTLILSGGYNLQSANNDLAANKGDLIAFGRPFISNPDLVDRFQTHSALAEPIADTFYTPGEEGYNDYPLLQA